MFVSFFLDGKKSVRKIKVMINTEEMKFNFWFLFYCCNILTFAIIFDLKLF